MSKPSSAAEEESRAAIAHNLARLIFEQKRQKIQEDPNFKLKSKVEQQEILSFKTDTYLSMEKMIENIKKYREEYTGNRTPAFLQQRNQKRAHFEEDLVLVEEEDQSINKTRENQKRKDGKSQNQSKKQKKISPSQSTRNLLKNEVLNTKDSSGNVSVNQHIKQFYSYGANSYNSNGDSISQGHQIRKSGSLSIASNKVNYIPKGGLFSKNGLYRILAKENQQKRVSDALKEKEIFDKINLKNEQHIQAYREKMRNSQNSQTSLSKGTYDADGNYIAFELDLNLKEENAVQTKFKVKKLSVRDIQKNFYIKSKRNFQSRSSLMNEREDSEQQRRAKFVSAPYADVYQNMRGGSISIDTSNINANTTINTTTEPTDRDNESVKLPPTFGQITTIQVQAANMTALEARLDRVNKFRTDQRNSVASQLGTVQPDKAVAGSGGSFKDIYSAADTMIKARAGQNRKRMKMATVKNQMLSGQHYTGEDTCKNQNPMTLTEDPQTSMFKHSSVSKVISDKEPNIFLPKLNTKMRNVSVMDTRSFNQKQDSQRGSTLYSKKGMPRSNNVSVLRKYSPPLRQISPKMPNYQQNQKLQNLKLKKLLKSTSQG